MEIESRWLTETKVEIQVIDFLIKFRQVGRTPCKYKTYIGCAKTQTNKSATAKLAMKSSAFGRPKKRNFITTKHTNTLPIIPMKPAIEFIAVKAFSSETLGVI